MTPLWLSADALRVVCLGAHPDDIEIGCGGTLLTLAASRDVSIRSVVATGSGVRQDEAVNATAQFAPAADVEVRGLGLRDGYLPDHWTELKTVLEEVAGDCEADVVFAPRPDDAHQDHRVVAEVATTVWRDSLVLRYEIPKWDGDLGKVTHYVPLDTETASRKVELLDKCFPSQVARDWWDAETFLGLMRLRGIECRHRYAEGFLAEKVVFEFLGRQASS